MTDKPENPPAFPHSFRELAPNTVSFSTGGGMTLRDYFAAHCPMTLETYLKGINPALIAQWKTADALKSFSQARYQYADTMLTARSGHE